METVHIGIVRILVKVMEQFIVQQFIILQNMLPKQLTSFAKTVITICAS